MGYTTLDCIRRLFQIFAGWIITRERRLLDDGQIVEVNEPAAFFSHPQHERTKLFLSQILR